MSVDQQKVGKRDEEYQERAQELEERLKESSQQRETLTQEVDSLNHSLQQETQLRNSAEGKIAEVNILHWLCPLYTLRKTCRNRNFAFVVNEGLYICIALCYGVLAACMCAFVRTAG